MSVIVKCLPEVIAGLILVFLLVPVALAGTVLYGGLGGHGVSSGPQASTNDGALVIVSQIDGSTTVVGHPAGVARISGLIFGLDGTLFAATQDGGGFRPPPGPISTSNLIRINPDTGALISSVPIADGATALSIADLAVKELADELDPNLFWQILRSTLVNVSAIAGVHRDFKARLRVRLKDRKETLAVSQPYTHKFKHM